MKKYEIWDKKSDIYTPGTNSKIKNFTYSTDAGTSRFTAEEWMKIHPVPPKAVILCSAGDYNGGFFGTLGQLEQIYSSAGVDFSNAKTDEDKLSLIEAFESEANKSNTSGESTPEERTAAALEAIVMHNMDAVNNDDPDE